MMDRRMVIKTGTSAIALALAPQAGAAEGDRGASRLHSFLYHARAFSDHAMPAAIAGDGARLLSIENDLSRAWYEELRDEMIQRPSIVAGLTDEKDEALFVAFAREIRYRRLFRAGPGPTAGTTTLSGSRNIIDMPLEIWRDRAAALRRALSVYDPEQRGWMTRLVDGAQNQRLVLWAVAARPT